MLKFGVMYQDTPTVKATYTASMTAPAGLTVLMSAIRYIGRLYISIKYP